MSRPSVACQMRLDPSHPAREDMPDASETAMTDETTRDPVNAHGFEVQKRIGPTRLGVHKNWEWYDDPKRVMFSLSRYKFVAKMFEGRKNVLEFGCGDGWNAPIVKQGVEQVPADIAGCADDSGFFGHECAHAVVNAVGGCKSIRAWLMW